MSDNTPARIGRWAATTNMTLALETMYEAINAPEGVDKMLIFYGQSGLGKSIAVANVANAVDAVYVSFNRLWTHKWLLAKIGHELGLVHMRGTTVAMLDAVIERINERRCPLIFDETDYMIERGTPEILRDIYVETGVPLMMVGEEAFPDRVKRWERFDNRILRKTRALPLTTGDGRLLRDIYCTRVRIEDDLADHLTAMCKGVARHIVTALHNAQTAAIDQLDSDRPLDLAGWQGIFAGRETVSAR